MFKVGKLYKYTCVWSTGIYSSPLDAQYKSKLRQDEIVVLLEQRNISTHMHYKILTAKGEVGWITVVESYLQLI